MKPLFSILRFPAGTDEKYAAPHHVWLGLVLTGLGCCVGVLSLMFAATAYIKLPGGALFRSYFQSPAILGLNLLVPVLLIWLFYFLTRRCWAAFLGSYLPCIAIALVNYFKIRLRSDPFLAADLRLASEAGGIMGNYELELTWLVWFALACLVSGLVFTLLLAPNGLRGWKKRTAGFFITLALLGAAVAGLYVNPTIYNEKTVNNEYINQWSDVEVFSSKGCIYPFLYSLRDMIPTPPKDYDSTAGAQLLGQYHDADIPENQRVSIMGVMLEAFCDLSKLDVLADNEAVAQVYAPWHALEEQSISGTLLTNIFAGGTVDSEWGFLTGYSTHDEFRKNTDSYVWYLRNQGYQTFGSHVGFGWFYNRQNVNQYLGFEEYRFTENYYGKLVDPIKAIWNSDQLLVRELVKELKERVKSGPCFSFSVSYQNHGPYEYNFTTGKHYFATGELGLSEASANIWNNYLKGVSDTIDAMTKLADGLEAMDEPVVLVLFGDHKPWAGNGSTAYHEMGVDFNFDTLSGFRDYYGTPYLIWANSAAKQVLGKDFTGDGGEFSPCFLMPKVFDACGWQGPGFMQLSRQLREITPLMHTQNLYLWEGGLTNELPNLATDFINQFIWAQYYRENEIQP